MHKLLRIPGPLASPVAGGPFTLFGSGGGAALTADTAAYTMGVEFSVSRGAQLLAVRFNSPAGAVSLPSVIALYTVAGTALVTSQAAAWSGAVGSGWVEAAFSAPPALAAGTAYVGCIGSFDGNFFYGGTPHYFDSGAGAGGITSGILSAPNNAGATGGQMRFTQAAVLSYPATAFNATCYWVDVKVA